MSLTSFDVSKHNTDLSISISCFPAAPSCIILSSSEQQTQSLIEALVHAAIALESLVHLFLSAQGLSKKERKNALKKAEGIPGWLRKLNPQGLVEECENVAKLWKLRNKAVHEQNILSENDIELIRNGIRRLALVRTYLLRTGKPDILRQENRFSSFLERVELEHATDASIGQVVQMKFGWHREKDCHQKATRSARISWN